MSYRSRTCALRRAGEASQEDGEHEDLLEFSKERAEEALADAVPHNDLSNITKAVEGGERLPTLPAVGYCLSR